MVRAKWLILLLLQELSPIKAQREDSSDSASGEWKPSKVNKECDAGTQRAPRGGNLGQTDLFPWLGVIKVHIHKAGSLQVALTGIVLVKRAHAVGNADELSRIPKTIFKEHSTAMFVATTNEPWYCKLKDYMIHPEYDYATLNTIALVELNSNEQIYPMMPICWPSYSYNASRDLYAMGYQDDNKILEKNVFVMDYVDTGLCEEFYNRVGYKSQDISTAPTHLLCGFAPHNRNSCVWDSGMALASNTTGTWMLLGLGVHGPGCAAPARFIEMLPYLPWIDSAMGLDEIEDQYSRRSIDDVAVPSPLVIDRADKSTLYIRKAADTEDICNSLHNELIFHERRKLLAPSQGGGLMYKISLQSQNNTNSFCCEVKVKQKGKQKDTSVIYTAKNDAEAEFKMVDEFKIIIPPDNPKIPKEGTLDWEPWIKTEDQHPSDQKAFDTFVRLEFEDEADIEIQVFRPRQGLLASGITNASQRDESNGRQFGEVMNNKELKAFEDFSAEVRRRDAEVQLKTNTSTEVNSKNNKKTIPERVEPYKKDFKNNFDENYETTDKSKVKVNKPRHLDMDLDHYDAVRLPENNPVVIVDKSDDNIFDGLELNNLTKIDFRHEIKKKIKNTAEMIEVDTKHTEMANKTTDVSNNKPVAIGVTGKIEAVESNKIADITEKSTPEIMNSSSSDKFDSIHPKESALVKGLTNEAEELKCILQLIFIETFVLWIAIEI